VTDIIELMSSADRRRTLPSVTVWSALLSASSVVMATRAAPSPSAYDPHRTFAFSS